MTIVPADKIQNDPQHILYHFPSMNAVKYTKLSQEYHFWRSVDVAEQTARMFGSLLLPARCIHWERKTRLASRRIQIGKKSFYILKYEELTEIEWTKYKEEVAMVNENGAENHRSGQSSELIC